MGKPFKEWTVLPHGQLQRVDDGLLSVTGLLPMPAMGEVSRRMTVVRLHDGRLVIYSAIALDQDEMDAIEDYGAPAFLIVPGDIHRMDAKPWKQRYPSLTVVTPAGARKKVEEVVPVDATEVDFGDPSVRFVAVPGTDEMEAALLIERDSGTTVVLNDLIFNLANRPGVMGWLFKTIGLTGQQPHIPAPIRMREVKDKAAVATQLDGWAQLPRLKRVIISHGEIITESPSTVLSRIAAELRA